MVPYQRPFHLQCSKKGSSHPLLTSHHQRTWRSILGSYSIGDWQIVFYSICWDESRSKKEYQLHSRKLSHHSFPSSLHSIVRNSTGYSPSTAYSIYSDQTLRHWTFLIYWLAFPEYSIIVSMHCWWRVSIPQSRYTLPPCICCNRHICRSTQPTHPFSEGQHNQCWYWISP